MTARRELVFAAIEAQLAAMDMAVAELDRMPSGDPSSFPAIHIQEFGQGPEKGEVRTTRYDLQLTIEGYVERAGGTAAHQELNELHASMMRAMFAGYDVAPLGGTVDEIEEGDMRVAQAPLASSKRLAFSQDFNIVFATVRGDPEQ